MDKEEKKPLGKKTYVDGRGYMRFIDSDRLVSRWVARKEIYVNNRRKYPLKFESYIVHHKDGDKLNNDVDNLEILKRAEHENNHGIFNDKEQFKKFVIYAIIILVIVWGTVFLFSYFGEEKIICSTNTYDCDDFTTQAEAQKVLEECGYSDIHYLDGDNDKLACENLP